MRILITLLLMTLPLRAAADIDCSVIDALERVQFAQMRLAENPRVDAASVDAQLIIAQVGRLDEVKLRMTIAPTLTTLDRSRVMAFFNHSQTLRLTLLATHTDQAANILQSPAFTQHITNLKRILPLFACNTLGNISGVAGADNVASPLGFVKSAQSLKFMKAGIWFFVIVGLLIVALKFRSSLTTRKARNQRRAKRYHVHILTELRNRGLTQKGTILDISCTGIKIQTTLFKAHRIGDHIEVFIDQHWKTAQITWANAHYLGVQFDEALDHDYVMLLNASEQKSLRTNKNGARLGAALNNQR